MAKKPRNIAQITKDIEAIRKQIGKDRDKLDELIVEAEGLKECCERAHDSLESARDALSELA
jgi:septal ring factor EnvC (AmiA/AmiB activator)